MQKPCLVSIRRDSPFTRSYKHLHLLLFIAGKMFGLHSGDGHVMWSLTYPLSQAPQHIFPWRSSHDIQRAPELIALHSSDSASSYSVVDAHTGQELGSAALSFPVSQVCLDAQENTRCLPFPSLPFPSLPFPSSREETAVRVLSELPHDLTTGESGCASQLC